jgi:hypothetical protein
MPYPQSDLQMPMRKKSANSCFGKKSVAGREAFVRRMITSMIFQADQKKALRSNN